MLLLIINSKIAVEQYKLIIRINSKINKNSSRAIKIINSSNDPVNGKHKYKKRS